MQSGPRRQRTAGLRALALVALVFAGCAAFPFGSPDPNVPLPYPAGCAAFGLSELRCAAIVDQLAEQAMITPEGAASIELLGDPGCGEGLDPNVVCFRTTRFVVRVRFRMQDGHSVEGVQYCGVGGQFSILCTENPEIRVWTIAEGYFDVPCAGETPDTCATRFPAPDAGTAKAARPIEVPRLEIPIDHAGKHTIEVGRGALANGLLETVRMQLAGNVAPGLLLDEGGIGLTVESLEPDGLPFDNYYLHGRRAGVERIRAVVQFTVLSFEPGATIVLELIEVR